MSNRHWCVSYPSPSISRSRSPRTRIYSYRFARPPIQYIAAGAVAHRTGPWRGRVLGNPPFAAHAVKIWGGKVAPAEVVL